MLIRHMKDDDEPVVELARANYDGVMAEHHSAEILAGFRDDVTPQSFRDQMAWKQVFVAEEAGEVVATGALADLGSPGAPKYTVSQLYVRSDVHGGGVGTRLLAHIGETAKSAGADRLHVPSSRNAIRFYERAGFTVDSGQPDAAIEITWMTMSLRGAAEQARRADRP